MATSKQSILLVLTHRIAQIATIQVLKNNVSQILSKVEAQVNFRLLFLMIAKRQLCSYTDQLGN